VESILNGLCTCENKAPLKVAPAACLEFAPDSASGGDCVFRAIPFH